MPACRTEPRFLVARTDPRIDEPVSLRLAGVPPGRRVRIFAAGTDAHGVEHRSWAEYEAGPDALVEPARQRPLAGTYRNADPFGLWWSMQSDPERPFARSLGPVPTAVWAEIDGERVADVELRRLRLAPGVTVEPWREGGLVATLFLPGLPAPGIVVLGGSEGGLAQAEELAAGLASHGFAALALAYFGAAGLPERLAEIPLEYLEAAVDRLLARPEIAGPGAGIVGISRGGELALLFASRCPKARAVVGFAASSVLWAGLTPGEPRPRTAWTHRGKPLPFAVPLPPPWLGLQPGRPLALRESFVRGLQDERQARRAAIPVERIRGPVLLVSGKEDAMWPSCLLGELAMFRLARADRPRRGLHLAYPGAGHAAGRLPGVPAAPIVAHPPAGWPYTLGGRRSANARSARHSWPRVLAFLDGALRPEPDGRRRRRRG